MRTRALFLLLLCWPAWAAFPTVESSSSGTSTGDTTPTLTMPATVSADAVIFACHNSGDGNIITWNTATYGTWDLLFNVSVGVQTRLQCRAILADGDEDSGTFDNTQNNAVDASWFIYSIIGWENDTVANGVECATAATGLSVNPDPPSLTPSWGDDDNLYLAVFSSDGAGTISVHSLPDNQIGLESTGTPDFNKVHSGSGTDELTGASQNPGAYTKSTSDDWIANTCVVQPASASNTPLRRRR